MNEERRAMWERLQAEDDPDAVVVGFTPRTAEEIEEALARTLAMKVDPLPEDIEALGDEGCHE